MPPVILHRIKDWSKVKNHLRQLSNPYEERMRGTGLAIYLKVSEDYDLLVDKLIKHYRFSTRTACPAEKEPVRPSEDCRSPHTPRR